MNYGPPQFVQRDMTQPGAGMQLPASMPGGGLAMGALGGALRGMTPRLPMDPMSFANAMGGAGGGSFNPQLLAALLGR